MQQAVEQCYDDNLENAMMGACVLCQWESRHSLTHSVLDRCTHSLVRAPLARSGVKKPRDRSLIPQYRFKVSWFKVGGGLLE